MAAIWRGLVIRFTWIPVHQKCPYCGHWRGGIVFDHEDKKIVHRCRTCHGLWAEEPLTKLLPARTPTKNA